MTPSETHSEQETISALLKLFHCAPVPQPVSVRLWQPDGTWISIHGGDRRTAGPGEASARSATAQPAAA